MKNRENLSLKIKIIIEKAKDPKIIKNWVFKGSDPIYLEEKIRIKEVTKNSKDTKAILVVSKTILQSPNTEVIIEELRERW